MSLPRTDIRAAVTPVFAALGDITRLELAHRLADGSPRSIAQLADGLELSHQGVTKHLKVLESAGLVRAQKVGRERRYVCEPETLQTASSYLNDIATQWDGALARLKAFVEGDSTSDGGNG